MFRAVAQVASHHQYQVSYEARDKENKKHSIHLTLNLDKAGMTSSDHHCANNTFNIWAPGTPRSDRSLQEMLVYLSDKKAREITYYCELHDIDMSKTKLCRLDGEETIKLHLKLTAATMLQQLQGQPYIALQELPDPMTVEPLPQFAYLVKMLKHVNKEKKYFSDDEMQALLKMFELSYMRKHKVHSTKFGHGMLINPKFVKACIRLESPELQFEGTAHLRAHLYLLTNHDDTQYLIANAHSDFVTPVATMEHVKYLVEQGFIVCGDVNISEQAASHAAARELIEKMLASGRYLFATDLASGRTYDIHVRLKDDATYQSALAHTLQAVNQQVEWKQVKHSYVDTVREAITRSHFSQFKRLSGDAPKDETLEESNMNKMI